MVCLVTAGHLTGCGEHPHPPNNRSFFPHKTEKLCHISDKQLLHSPRSKTSEEIDYSEVVFLLKQRRKHACPFMTNF